MSHKIDRTGEEKLNNFGSKMIIKRYANNLDLDIYFPEYDFTVEHKSYKNFNKGLIKCPYEPRLHGVGYIGHGKYSELAKIKTDQYSKWSHMLGRCYDETRIKSNLTYKDVTVCKEWHNFQNFAKWYEDNYYEVPGCKMELDKDILVKGNKVYSPKTCVFVPQRINYLFLKCNKSRGEYPIGVYLHKSSGKYMVRISNVENKREYIGEFGNYQDAFNAYKINKESLILDVANKYKEYLPSNLYNAMCEYKVEITD